LSPAPEKARPRANSVKRKEPDGPTFAEITSGEQQSSVTINDGLVTELSTDIAKVNSVCDTVTTDIAKMNLDPAVVTIFSGILEAVRGVSSVQSRIVQNWPTSENVANTNSQPYTGAIPKRPRPAVDKPDKPVSEPAPVSENTGRVAPLPAPVIVVPESEPETAEDRKIQKFKETIRDAEKSTVIFNLDMGRVPVMNKETMAKRATLSLATMAAKLENKNATRPTADTIEIIDDVLSLSTNMELLGNETRTYNNAKDPLRGSFCTVPVRYEFRDPGLKFKAEKVLRKTCGVNCATPYPLVVRECIKQIVAVVKNRYPDNFVRVTVDTKNMVFKAARKPPKDAVDPRWKYREEHIPIPELALEVGLRKLPYGFKLDIPDSPGKPANTSRRESSNTSRRESVEMEAAGAAAPNNTVPPAAGEEY
jgi:hypothetical protein